MAGAEEDSVRKMAREAAARVKRLDLANIKAMNTVALVIIEKVNLNENGVPRSVDIRLKHEPKADLIPDCPLAMLTDGTAYAMPPIKEGAVALAIFSMVALDDLIVDKKAHPLVQKSRAFSRMDAIVLPGFPVTNFPLDAPALYKPEEDFLIHHPDAGSILMDASHDRIILGNPDSSLVGVVIGIAAGPSAVHSDKVFIGE